MKGTCGTKDMIAPAKKWRLRWVFVALFVLVVGTVGWAMRKPTPEEPIPHVLSIEEGGYLYTYHVLSRTEALFDATDDPKRLRNLSRSRPNETALLRGKLARRLGLAELTDLDETDVDPLRAKLKSLGYMR